MVSLAAGGEPAALKDPDALAAQEGDEVAFARLIRRYEGFLNSRLLMFTSDRTVLQDLCQETYLELCRSLPAYRHQGPFYRWLGQIAARVGYRHWLRLAKEIRIETTCRMLPLQDSLDASALRRREDALYVNDLLACLDHCDRSLLEMRYIHGLSATEIAQGMGWNTSRVRVRLHRAIRKLRIIHGICLKS